MPKPLPRMRNLALWRAIALLVSLIAVMAPARQALALKVGTYPTSPFITRQVYGGAQQFGASLMTNFTYEQINDKLLSQSSDNTQNKLPSDAVIKDALLYWGGSALNGPDDTATFTLADGTQQSISADLCRALTDPGAPGSPGGSGTHFLCRADVTKLLAAHPVKPGNYNGTYSVGDVTAKAGALQLNSVAGCPGGLDGQAPYACCQPGDTYCQARHASWSLVVIYESPSEFIKRDVFFYDGFVLLDEQPTTLGQISFTINGFLVADPPEAKLSYYALEGDQHLGNPEQDSVSSYSEPCPTCWDFVSFNGSELTGGAGNNEPHNIMNSTPQAGIDLDTFDVSSLVKVGDTQANFLVSSGNGSLSDNTNSQNPPIGSNMGGNGELFFYSYTLLQINRKAPNYKNIVSHYTVNSKEATTASPGEIVNFQLDLLNTGQLDADNNILKLDQFLPPGMIWVPNSLVVDGVSVKDSAAGTSPLATGLNLGSITTSAGGNSARKVSFQLQVAANPGTSSVVSTGNVAYTYVGTKGSTTVYNDTFSTNQVSIAIVAPAIAEPKLSVAPATVKPGETVTYVLSVQNTSAGSTPVGFTWDAPKEVQLVNAMNCTFDVAGAGTVIKIDPSAGANKTGLITTSGLGLAAGKTATCTWTATVLSDAALAAAGIAPINGHVVSVQASVVVGGKTFASDDPATSGTGEATKFTIASQSSFVNSTKTMTDLSPSTPLEAGDQVRFDITLTNSGPSPGVVTITDPLPSQLTFVSSQSPELLLVGTTVQAKAVTIKPASSQTFSFTAQIKADTPAGSTFANVATLSPSDSPAVVVQTPTQTVTGGPDLTTSQKTVVDVNGGDLEPGDTLQYTLTFKNTGKLPSGDFGVVDPIDPNLQDVSGITGTGSFDAAAKQIAWKVPSIAAGGQAVLQFQAKVGPLVPTGTTIGNNATASGGELPKPVPVSATIKVQAQPNISTWSLVATSSSGGAFNPGDTVTYTLKLQNTGTGAVQAGKVSLDVDALLTGLAATAGGTVAGQKITWDVGTLQKGGAIVTLSFTGKLAAIVPQNQPIAAQASLTGDGLGAPALSDDPLLPGKADPTVFKVTSAPILATSTKAYIDLNGGQVQGGDQIQFKVTLTNTGNAPATGVTVSDTLAAQLTQVVVTGGSFDAVSRVAKWPVANIDPGKPVDVALTAVVDKTTASGTTVSNSADITLTETPKSAKTNTVSFQVVNLPDFGASTKAVSAATVQAGDAVTWTLTIVNSGNQAGTGVVVSDVLPKEIEQIQLSDGGVLDGTGTAKWSLGSLAAGAQKVLTVQGKLKKPLAKGTQVCNQATISATENPAPVQTNPPGTTPKPGGTATCFAVDSASKLSFTKDVFDQKTNAQLNGGTAKPKQVLRWVLHVKNIGNAAADSVVVSDVIPQGLTDIVPLDGGKFDATLNQITWPVAASLGVAATDELVFRFDSTVLAGADNALVIANQAQLVYTGLPTPQKSDDPLSAAKEDATQVQVQSNVDFSKATLTVADDNGGDAHPGDSLTWTLKLQNDGDGTGKDVTVVLPLDPKLEQVTADNGGQVTPGTVIWKLGTLAPGGSFTLTLKTVLKKPLANGAVVTLQGQLAAAGFKVPMLTDADLSTPVREVTKLTVKAAPDYSTSAWSVQDLNGGAFEPGDAVVLRLTVRNTGDGLGQLVPVQAILQPGTLADVKSYDGGKPATDGMNWTVPTVGLSPTGDVAVTLQATIAAGLQDGQIITVLGTLPGVVNPPQAKLVVSAKPKFDASLMAIEDESGWIAKVGQTAPGHTLRLETTLKNTGKALADGLVVTLALPNKVGQVQIITPGGVQQGQSLVWSLPALAAGGQTKLIYKVVVASDAKDGETLAFSGSVAATGLATPAVITGPTATVTLRPILKLTKSYEDLTGKHLFPGDTVRFVLSAANVGNATASNVLISDILAVSLTGIQAESQGVVNGQVVTWSIPALQAGQTVAVAVRAKVVGGVASGSTIVNQAIVKADGLGEAQSNALQVPVNYPTLDVQLGLLPEAPAKLPLQPGDTVTLQVQITAQNQQASGVSAQATIDASVFDVVALQGASYDAKTQTLTWTAKDSAALANLALAKPAVLLVGLRVKATAEDGKKAEFTGLAREGETGIAYPAPGQSVPIASHPQLKLQKTVKDLNGGKPNPLDVMRYELTVSVAGNAAAQNVAVSDPIDNNLEFVSADQGGVFAGGTVGWNPSTMAALAEVLPGKPVVLHFDVRIKAAVSDNQTIANQAQATAKAVDKPVQSDDPAQSGTADPTLVVVRVQSALEASQKLATDDNGGALLVGDTVTWKLVLVATATTNLSGLKVFDGVPAGTDYVPGSTQLNGQSVADAAGGTLPLVSGMGVQGPGMTAGSLQPGAENAAIVTFKTRVRADAADGALVTNLATATATGVPPTAVGPVALTVGKTASLKTASKTAELQDSNANGIADVGEELRYVITVKNTGGTAASAVTVDDPLPVNLQLVGASMQLDGQVLTDAQDLDAAWFDAAARTVHAKLADVAAGQTRVLTLRVRILAGPLAENQATVQAKGLAPELTDSDGNDGNGNQPTVVAVGAQAQLAQVFKSVQDENGGQVQIGDVLRYTIQIKNLGANPLGSVQLRDALPVGLQPTADTGIGAGDPLVPEGTVVNWSGTQANKPTVLTVAGLSIQSGETATVTVRARVGEKASEGAVLCNVAEASVPGASAWSSKPACATVGVVVGEGMVRGTVFEDVGAQDGVFQSSLDLPLPGFQVQLLPLSGDGAVSSALADDKGAFKLLQVPEGKRKLRVLNANGVVFYEAEWTAPGAAGGTLDLPVKPTGRLYDPRTGELVVGAKVFLSYDAADPLAPGQTVPDSELLAGQQGQKTDATGAYIFAAASGRAYRIDVAASAIGRSFPSTAKTPEANLVLLDGAGFVVESALPKLTPSLPKYLQRFTLQGEHAPPAPRHNHIPVDKIASLVHVSLQLSKTSAQVGEMVGVTVKVVNGSTSSLAPDLLTGQGGAELRQVLPPGLSLVPGTARMTLVRPGGATIDVPLAPISGNLLTIKRAATQGGQALGLDLPAGGELTFKVLAAVGASAAVGANLSTVAQLYDTGGGALSDRATAALQVQADPLFDRAGVLTKVFCDGNGDGVQQEGEDGLPGARIYVDTGEYAAADAFGRAHFVNLPAGTHLFKVDPDTLPPGSTFVEDGKQALLLTPGLTQAMTFAVRCALEPVGPGQLEVVPGADVTPVTPGPGVVLVETDVAGLDVAIDGKKLAARRITAAIATTNERPATLSADPTAVVLAQNGELALWTTSTGGFTRHVLEIRPVSDTGRRGEPLFEAYYGGEVPRKLVFTLAGGNTQVLGKLEPGRHYAVVLRAETSFGSRAWSAPQPFEVKASGAPVVGNWHNSLRKAAWLINGHALELAGDRGQVRILRPEDGRLLITVRGADSSGRDEFMTVGKAAAKDAVIKPVWGTVAAPKPVPVAAETAAPVVAPAPAPVVAPAPAPVATPTPAPVATPTPVAKPVPVVAPPVAPTPVLAPTPEPAAVDLPKPVGKPAVAAPAEKPVVVAPAPKPVVVAPVELPVAPAELRPLAVSATAKGLRVGSQELLPRTGTAELQVPSQPLPLAGGKILGQLMLSARQLPEKTKEAALVLLGNDGQVLARKTLQVPVPSSFLWAPNAQSLKPGRYGIALEVLWPDGDHLAGYRTVPKTVMLAENGPALLPAGDPDKFVRATLFDASGQPTESTWEWLGKLAATLAGEKDKIAVISVHDDGAGEAMPRSTAAAKVVEKALLSAGVGRDRLLVIGVGNLVPDAKPGHDALGPHRVELRWRSGNTGSSEPSTEDFAVPQGVWVDDVRAGASAMPSELSVKTSEPSRVIFERGKGPAGVWLQRFGKPPGGVAVAAAPQEASRDVASFGGELLDSLAADVRATEAGKPRKPAGIGAPLQPISLAEGSTETTLPPAAELQVWLPPAGRELGAAELPVRGLTRPGNTITVQGNPVPVGPDGRFYSMIALPVGSSTLTVTSKDPAGNKAILQRNFAVRDRALFILAIADTSVSHVGANLVEMERGGGSKGWQDGVWQVGDSVNVMGRGAVYLKGRIAGKYLGLDNLRFTAHLDTAKDPATADFATNLIDPTRFYPVYGDASVQVQDAQARGKLYVLVEADQGKLQLGNFRATVQGLELLRYDRALYGAKVEAKLGAAGSETKASIFAAIQDKAVARRSDVLRGTGGSLYYTSGRDVLEGSEKIELVVRDRVSGLELSRISQTRNTDYTIDYREGRVLFKSPINSAVDGAFGMAQNGLTGGHLSWNGQPVFVEVVYESRTVQSTDDAAFGGQIKQQVGPVTLGAGYVQEGRGESDPTFRSVGADASVKIGQRGKASVEYAYSQSRDTRLSVSDDGGLTFGAPISQAAAGKPAEGQAVKAQVEVALADLLGKPADLAKDASPTDPGRVRAYYQWVQPGFQSGGTIAQQGQQRFGVDSQTALGVRNTLTVRYDGLIADGNQAATFAGPGTQSQWGVGPLANSGSYSAWTHHSVVLQDAQKLDARWTATGGAGWGWSLNGDTASQSATVALGAAYRATDRLTLRGDQQAVAMGDPSLVRDWGDRMISSLGAEYKLDKALALTLTERLGWAGQNSTAAGLRTYIDKDTAIYAQQRLEDTLQTGRPVSATVLGAESRYGSDQLSRAYAEYQIDALNSGSMNRATMGVGKRFIVTPGLTLDAGYERQQVFSGPSGTLGRDALSVGGEWLRPEWWKVTTRQEVRMDSADAGTGTGAQQKLQVLSLNNGQLMVSRSLTLFVRANYLRTQNQTTNQTETESLESTLGLALRPVHTNWLNLIGKLTRLAELRPATTETGPQERSDKWIAAIEPTAELPYRLQLSLKGAFQRSTELLTDIYQSQAVDKILSVARLGWHASQVVDVAAEYRYLTTPQVGDSKHGALLETAYLIAKAVRVGVGYNFSHIVQTPQGAISETTNPGGFYVRLIGMY